MSSSIWKLSSITRTKDCLTAEVQFSLIFALTTYYINSASEKHIIFDTAKKKFASMERKMTAAMMATMWVSVVVAPWAVMMATSMA